MLGHSRLPIGTADSAVSQRPLACLTGLCLLQWHRYPDPIWVKSDTISSKDVARLTAPWQPRVSLRRLSIPSSPVGLELHSSSLHSCGRGKGASRLSGVGSCGSPSRAAWGPRSQSSSRGLGTISFLHVQHGTILTISHSNCLVSGFITADNCLQDCLVLVENSAVCLFLLVGLLQNSDAGRMWNARYEFLGHCPEQCCKY